MLKFYKLSDTKQFEITDFSQLSNLIRIAREKGATEVCIIMDHQNVYMASGMDAMKYHEDIKRFMESEKEDTWVLRWVGAKVTCNTGNFAKAMISVDKLRSVAIASMGSDPYGFDGEKVMNQYGHVQYLRDDPTTNKRHHWWLPRNEQEKPTELFDLDESDLAKFTDHAEPVDNVVWRDRFNELYDLVESVVNKNPMSVDSDLASYIEDGRPTS